MNVVTIEAEAFKSIVGMFETTMKTVTKLAEENKKLKDDRWMSIKEVSEYTGFSASWVLNRKEDLGFFQDGCKDLKFKKSMVDSYMDKKFIQRKPK